MQSPWSRGPFGRVWAATGWCWRLPPCWPWPTARAARKRRPATGTRIALLHRSLHIPAASVLRTTRPATRGTAAPTGPFCPHIAADSRPSRAWPCHARGGPTDPDAPTDSRPENTLVNGSSLALSRVWLGLLVLHLGPVTGPLCLGIDEIMERRKGSIGRGCAPPMVTSRKRWCCGGSACCGGCSCHGRGASGPCLFSPCWPPPPAALPTAAAGTRPSPTGRGRGCAVCDAGSPTAPWWWLATGATRPCACGRPASG